MIGGALADVITDEGPFALANRLASYKHDASYIRRYVRAEHGKTPTLHQIEQMIEAHRKAKVKARQTMLARGEPTASDAEVYAPKRIDKPKRHTKPRTYTYRTGRTVRQITDVVAEARIASLPNPTHAKRITEVVAEAFGMTYDDLVGPTRRKAAVAARSVVARLLRERNEKVYSYPQIATVLGRNGDHSSAMYWHKMFPVFAKQFPDVHKVYKRLGGTDAA